MAFVKESHCVINLLVFFENVKSEPLYLDFQKAFDERVY